MADPQALRRGGLAGTLLSTSVRLLDLPSRYGFHLLIAYRLGVTQAGAFYIVYSVLMFLSGFGRLGIDRALTRSVARAMAHGDTGQARHAIGQAFRAVLAMSVGVTLLILALAWPLAAYVLRKPDLAWPFAIGAAIILPQCLSVVAAGALAGLHRVAFSQMIYSWLMPALFCAGALLIPIDITRALLLIFACTIVNALIGGVLLYMWLPPRGDPAARPAAEPLLATGVSLFTTEAFQLLLSYAPIFLLGVLASDAAVGLYALAWRIALAINLLVSVMGAVAAPRFATLHAHDDFDGLARASGQYIGIVIALAIVPVLLLSAIPGRLLGYLGHDYAAAATTLRILLVGQSLAVCATALPELLGMTGHAAVLRRINLEASIVLLAGLVLLSPWWGSEGAALATTITLAVLGWRTAAAVRRALGFTPLLALFGRLAPAARRAPIPLEAGE